VETRVKPHFSHGIAERLQGLERISIAIMQRYDSLVIDFVPGFAGGAPLKQIVVTP